MTGQEEIERNMRIFGMIYLALGVVLLSCLGSGVQISHSSVEVRLLCCRHLARLLRIYICLLGDRRRLLSAS